MGAYRSTDPAQCKDILTILAAVLHSAPSAGRACPISYEQLAHIDNGFLMAGLYVYISL